MKKSVNNKALPSGTFEQHNVSRFERGTQVVHLRFQRGMKIRCGTTME